MTYVQAQMDTMSKSWEEKIIIGEARGNAQILVGIVKL